MAPSRRLLAGLFAGVILLVMVAVANLGLLSPIRVGSITIPPAFINRADIPEPGKINKGRLVIDYTGAQKQLEDYRKLFSDKRKQDSLADPRKPDTVKTWWEAAALIEWYTLNKPRYRCLDIRNFGNWAACMDHPYTISAPCIVYSFGIAYDFSFDDAMAKHGCEVHSFDPSMNKDSYQRSNRSWFHNMGMSSRSTNRHLAPVDKVYVFKPQVWEMRTLTSVKKMLGHTGKVIDVLKIDIESFEWEVLDNLIETGELSNVRQFLVEFHLFPKVPPMEDYVNLFKSYTTLREELGFLEFKLYPHAHKLTKDKFNVQGDIHFVNSFFRYPSST